MENSLKLPNHYGIIFKPSIDFFNDKNNWTIVWNIYYMFIYNCFRICKSMANSIAFTFESVFITEGVIFNWSWCYTTRQSKLTKSLHTTFLKTLNYCNKLLIILGRNKVLIRANIHLCFIYSIKFETCKKNVFLHNTFN